MDNKELRVGIIGVGNIGSAHARTIFSGDVPNMRLCALCDISESKRAELREKYSDVPVFERHTELLDSGLCDAVIIATPHYLHPPIAIDAFDRGLDMLTEKPAGVDVASVEAMCEAAKRSGRLFAVMFNQRTNKLFREARRIVASGELGELRRVVWIVTNWYRKQSYYDSGDWRATWSGEGGGVLINQAPHNLDLWQWICGMPCSVRAECSIGKYHDIEVEDEAQIFAEYQNGATAVFITSTGDYPGTNRLEITGSKGKIVLEGGKLTHYKTELDESEYRASSKERKNPVTVTAVEDETYNGHREVLRNFARAALYGEPLIATGEEALNELTISNAAYLSAWTDKKITLPFDRDAFLRELEKRKDSSVVRSASVTETSADGYMSRWNTNW